VVWDFVKHGNNFTLPSIITHLPTSVNIVPSVHEGALKSWEYYRIGLGSCCTHMTCAENWGSRKRRRIFVCIDYNTTTECNKKWSLHDN